MCLFTFTSNSVLRVFIPVIDAPNRLQLHATMDHYSFVSDKCLSDDEPVPPIFWLDRTALPKPPQPNDSDTPINQGRRLKFEELIHEDWELFAVIDKDGSFTVRALSVRTRPPFGSDLWGAKTSV